MEDVPARGHHVISRSQQVGSTCTHARGLGSGTKLGIDDRNLKRLHADGTVQLALELCAVIATNKALKVVTVLEIGLGEDLVVVVRFGEVFLREEEPGTDHFLQKHQ